MGITLVTVLVMGGVALAAIGIMVFQWSVVNRLEEKLISVVMDVHEESRFYHNAGRSSAEHQLSIERLNIEKIQAEAEKAKAEAARMTEERLTKETFIGTGPPKHGKRGHHRTVVEAAGGPNG